MRLFFLCFAFSLFCFPTSAQEMEAALPSNSYFPNIHSGKMSHRPTALSLPFFDDFTTQEFYPNQDLWIDQQVFINNTMASGIKSRGCATFDGFDQFGIPYDSMNANAQVFADSLTSQIIDLSGFTPADSIYLSFQFQSKGWGFSPKPEDSLQVYMLKANGSWKKVWSVQDTTYSDFKTAIIAITDTSFFNDHFQFRFVNKATVGISNSNWNVDYVYLNKDRSIQDIVFEDIAFTQNPDNLLNDFTAMPFNHFKTNPASFLKPNTSAYLRNNGSSSHALSYGLVSKESVIGTIIGNESGTITINGNQENNILLNTPNIGSFQGVENNQKYIFENKYFVESAYPNEPIDNDTIVQYQVFDNYFAYDDGSAEQVYFLNLFPNAPGQIAVEYALYQPDTIRGISVYLPRQVPTGIFKQFSLAIFKHIGINGQQDELIYQESYLYPIYQNEPNKFTDYVFEQPVAMPSGVFYVALLQSAGGSSDSLYIGLDKNRTMANHRYFNVDGSWVGSSLDGALMMRPLVGAALAPTSINYPKKESIAFSIYPNPTKDNLWINSSDGTLIPLQYLIRDVEGRVVLNGSCTSEQSISVEKLNAGVYFLQLFSNDKGSTTLKFIRQ